jgi:Family of unknown function (DUF5906)
MSNSLFLQTLYGQNTPPGLLTLWEKATKQSVHVDPADTAKAEAIAAQWVTESKDVYFGVALRQPGLASHQRGKVEACGALPGLFLDIDIEDGTGAHAAKNLPTADQAAEIVARYPEPSAIVNSGHGLHVYWLFDSVQPIDDANRAMLSAQSEAFQRKAIDYAKSKGWHVDATGNLDRILRLPGTINTKSGLNAPVDALMIDGPRYASPEALLEVTGVTVDAVTPTQPHDTVEGDHSPRLEEAAKQTDAAIREALGKLKNPESRELMGLVLSGQSFAPAGMRDQTLQRIASIVAYLAPDRDARELAEVLLSSSLATFEPDDQGKYTQADRVTWAAEKIARAQEDARRDRVAREGRDFGLLRVLLGKAREALALAQATGIGVADAQERVDSLEADLAEATPTPEKLNENYAWVESVARVVDFSQYATHVMYSRPYDFQITYDIHDVAVTVPPKKANKEPTTKYVPLGKYWLNWKLRTSYKYIGLYPPPQVAPPDSYNLWTGYGVDPKPGNWNLIRDFIREVSADSNPVIDEYIVKWIAWMIQNPGDRAGAVLILRGLKGTGKGTLGYVLSKIMGKHSMHLSDIDKLCGKFNAHLERVVFVFADEAYWPGYVSFEGNFKRLITEPTLSIERKGIDIHSAVNCLHVLMAANTDWIVPATSDERRYVVSDVSGKYRNNKAYFGALYNQIDNGGTEAMLYDLLHMDLQGWHPREVVDSAALTDQKNMSLKPAEKWLKGLLNEGYLPGYGVPVGVTPSHELKEHASAAHTKLHKEGFAELVVPLLKKLGCTPWRSKKNRGWKWPDLATARATWESLFWKTEWDNCDSWTQESPSPEGKGLLGGRSGDGVTVSGGGVSPMNPTVSAS